MSVMYPIFLCNHWTYLVCKYQSVFDVFLFTVSVPLKYSNYHGQSVISLHVSNLRISNSQNVIIKLSLSVSLVKIYMFILITCIKFMQKYRKCHETPLAKVKHYLLHLYSGWETGR